MAIRFKLPSPTLLLLMAIAAPTCLGAVMVASEVRDQIAILEQEAVSARLSSVVLETLVEAQFGRSNGGLPALSRTLESPSDIGRHPSVSAGLLTARQAILDSDKDRAVASLIDLVKTIGETGGLVLDTDAGRYAIMDSFIQQLPDLVALEATHQKILSSHGPSVTPSPESKARLLALEGLIARTVESIQRDVRDAFRTAPSHARRLAPPALEIGQALGDRGRLQVALQAYREAAIGSFLQMLEIRIRAWQVHALSTLSGLLLLLALAMSVALRILKRLTSENQRIQTATVQPGTSSPDRLEAVATGTAGREWSNPVPAGSARWSPDTDQEAV